MSADSDASGARGGLSLGEAVTHVRERFAFVSRLVRGGDASPAAFSNYVHWLASRRELR